MPGAGSFEVEMSHSCLSDRTIVVVEDHDDARRYLGLFLERTGAAVVEASNGFEGLEAVKNHQPDLVLSDINMPILINLTLSITFLFFDRFHLLMQHRMVLISQLKCLIGD